MLPRITLAAPDAVAPFGRGIRGLPITMRGGLRGLGACAPARGERLQTQDLNTCRPYMETYNVPCDANTINCVLFRKESFETNRNRIRAHLGRKPSSGAEAQYTWMNELCSLIDAAIYDTNIRPVWLFGGPISTDYNAGTILPYLPEPLWSRTRAFLTTLQISAAADGSCLPMVAFPCGLPLYHDPRAFTTNVGGCRRPSVSSEGSGATAQAVGTRGLGARPRYFFAPVGPGTAAPVGGRTHQFGEARTDWCGFNAALVTEVRRQLRAKYPGRVPTMGTDVPEKGRDVAILHLRAAPGEGLARGSFPLFDRSTERASYWRNLGGPIQRDRDGLEYVAVAMPKALTWMRYYETLAQDILATPFEVYVLYGLEQWASIMQVWAGRLNLAPEKFRDIVIQSREAQSRATTGVGFAIAAQVFTAANPIAGLVVQALGLVVDLMQALGGVAVGGWQCPTPLTVRSAQGDCDFSQLLGPDAVDRMERQRSGVEDYFDTSQRDESITRESPKIPKAVWVGGGLLAAGALAYYLLT